jgi:DNA-binding winged helix-turn-helix (wHTH) protein
MGISFGEFTLDRRRRQLLRKSKPIHLTPKALALLTLLVERSPNAVSKPEIHARVWPNTSVSDVNLFTLVFEVRSALNDTRRQRFIRTVWGYGYSFNGDFSVTSGLSDPTGRPHARLLWSDREIALKGGENILGRTEEAIAWIEDGSVSRHHARIVVQDGDAVLEDLGSRNGTQIDGKRIDRPTLLHDGARIHLGSFELTFRVFHPRQTDER